MNFASQKSLTAKLWQKALPRIFYFASEIISSQSLRKSNDWLLTHSMSARLSVPLLQVCCCGPRQAGDIDRLLQKRRANAGSATLSAYTGSWTQTCVICFQRLGLYSQDDGTASWSSSCGVFNTLDSWRPATGLLYSGRTHKRWTGRILRSRTTQRVYDCYYLCTAVCLRTLCNSSPTARMAVRTANCLSPTPLYPPVQLCPRKGNHLHR